MKPVRIALASSSWRASQGGVLVRPARPRPGEGWQGYVEGNLVYMAAEDGGRIETLTVEAGDAVQEGQFLFGLKSSSQAAQKSEAQARLTQAQAMLDNLKAALQRPEQIAVLRAQEERAKATLDLSKSEFERQQQLFARGISAKARLTRPNPPMRATRRPRLEARASPGGADLRPDLRNRRRRSRAVRASGSHAGAGA